MSSLILLAIGLDLWLGDPRHWPHPVILMGNLISALERRWNHGGDYSRRIKGGLLLVIVVGLSFGLVWGAIAGLNLLSPWLGKAAALYFLYSALAIRGLRDAALAIARPLTEGRLSDARRCLGMIVGRDTAALDEAEIARGAVESVAENTVDGITAPLFWALVGGAPLAVAYKAVNTLDSMLGHRNARFEDFGKAAARLDDLANWLPARLTAACLWLAGWMTPGTRRRGALAGTWRDAPRHPSPNAGWPEAMMAWLLGVQLGGISHYQGVPSHRALLGEPRECLDAAHIHRAVRLMHGGWLVFLLLGGLASMATSAVLSEVTGIW